MLEVYSDPDEELNFAIYVIDEKVRNKIIKYFKDSAGYVIELVNSDDDYVEIGEFLKDTLIVKRRHFNELFLEIIEYHKIDLHISQ